MQCFTSTFPKTVDKLKAFNGISGCKIRSVILGLALLLIGELSQANSFEVVAKKPFPVYKTQSLKKHNRLKVFRAGETALISPQKYGSWRKLLIVSESGDLISAWAHIRHLNQRARLRRLEDNKLDNYLDELGKSLAEEEIADEDSRKKTYQESVGIGMTLNISYLQWGERSFTLSDETQWTVSEVKSVTYWPSIYLDLSFGEKSALRFYAGYRIADFEGESSTDTIGTKQTNFNFKFLSFGAIYKMYLGKKNWWWGFAFEGAQAKELTISYDQSEIPVEKSDLPLFIFTYFSAGYDHPLTESIYLLPQVNAGVVYNQDPRIYVIESNVSMGWRF